MQLTTQYFGTTEYTEADGADFDAKEITLNNTQSVCTVMIFEGLSELELTQAVTLLDHIEELDNRAKSAIKKAYENNDKIVHDFINEHFQEYEEFSQQLLKELNIQQQDNDVFLANLKLGSIAIHNETDNNTLTATLDYNVIWEDGIPFTDQILAVRFNQQMTLLSIDHES